MLVLMQKNIKMEKERVISIPEAADESFAKTESILRK